MSTEHDIRIEDLDITPRGRHLGSLHAFYWECSCGMRARKGHIADWRRAESEGRLHVLAAETERESREQQDQGAARGHPRR